MDNEIADVCLNAFEIAFYRANYVPVALRHVASSEKHGKE
jgi:hypothetical protein